MKSPMRTPPVMASVGITPELMRSMNAMRGAAATARLPDVAMSIRPLMTVVGIDTCACGTTTR